MKKILVIGCGGRGHAICKQFLQSTQKVQIFAMTDNAGIAKIAKIVPIIKQNEHQKIIDFCLNEKIDFVFVGPEQPLVDGLVDDLQKNNIKVFGPAKKAAQLEGSKVFMKKILIDNNIATAKYQSFKDAKLAVEFAKTLGFPCVIKTDGLAAGKGVIIAQNLTDATKGINEIFNGKFGNAGKEIIIEEFLDGFEVSYFVICDGKNFIPLGFAHDHKRAFDNDQGLNTGGMGTYSPSPFISKEIEAEIIEKIIKPTLSGMEKIGVPFTGILFAGLMIGSKGIRVLEFNIRFGDPETQVILPRIKSDFVSLIEAAIAGKLPEYKLQLDEENKFVCVVLCAKGYPEHYQKGSEIKNLSATENLPNVSILHAGTREENGQILSNGGRVLNVIAKSEDFSKARELAYKAVDLIDWRDGFCRRDIAKKAV